MAKSKSRAKLWIAGARVRTLPLAVAPIIVASGAASALQAFNPLLTTLALVVSLSLQIGVNYANDYSDGVRGTDDHRVGPMRLTGSKQVPAKKVKHAAFIFFGVAAAAGLAIVAISGLWWLLAVGAVAIIAAWYYTGGKRPYGYAGLGELVVFIFFGPVAVCGTILVQFPAITKIPEVWLWVAPAAIGLGLYAAAVLMINNIRDIETDKLSGKNTLAVRLGKTAAKGIYFAMIWLPLAINYTFILFKMNGAFFMPLLLVFLLIPLTLIVSTAKTPPEQITALKLTSLAAIIFAVLVGFGMWRIF